MRSVAVVTTAFPTAAFFVEADVKRLHERGVRVQVFALRSPRGRSWQPEHESLLPLTRWVGSPLHPSAWIALLMWLLRKPHVLLPEWLAQLWASRRSRYALMGHVGYLPAAARIARLVEQGDFDCVHAAWAHFPGSVAYLVSRLTGRRFSMSAHAGSDLYRTQAFLKEKLRAARFTSACVRRNAEMLRDLGGPEARVECVYHGVDLRRFDGRKTRDPDPLLITVGRLAPAKGYDVAIRALTLLAARGLRPRLTLVGEGPERGRLESLVRESGLGEQVTFAGELPQGELVGLYARAWLLLAPSRVLSNGRRDGIPNVTVEAMAMGVPVLGTYAGGLDEAVVPGETGGLVAPDDPQAFADQLERLLADPGALDRMGERARQRAHGDFDARRNFERLFELLEGAPTTERRLGGAA
ncbi:MAG TPA: glycosyltransferase family 4 protein [Candidatus Eisenbacteria bacterium]|nr:glycosyltransferase family 4 protein [Candidatus Eisenbacteria bacterium]